MSGANTRKKAVVRKRGASREKTRGTVFKRKRGEERAGKTQGGKNDLSAPTLVTQTGGAGEAVQDIKAEKEWSESAKEVAQWPATEKQPTGGHVGKGAGRDKQPCWVRKKRRVKGPLSSDRKGDGTVGGRSRAHPDEQTNQPGGKEGLQSTKRSHVRLRKPRPHSGE